MKRLDLDALVAYKTLVGLSGITLQHAYQLFQNTLDYFHQDDDEYQGFNDENFKEVLVKYYREVVLTNKFSYFDKPISECSDEELYRWYVSFLNGANYHHDPIAFYEHRVFNLELENRSDELNKLCDYLDEVL
jgi:hypothetical protein